MEFTIQKGNERVVLEYKENLLYFSMQLFSPIYKELLIWLKIKNKSLHLKILDTHIAVYGSKFKSTSVSDKTYNFSLNRGRQYESNI